MTLVLFVRKNLFIQYERALHLNKHGIWFQFHQESHEQTWGEVCKPFTEARVNYCTKMMELFFNWLKQRDTVEFLTASEAAKLYLEKKPTGTIPMCMPYDWTRVPEEVPFWQQVREQKGYAGKIHKNGYMPIDSLYDYLLQFNGGDSEIAMKKPPWSESFFYFDADCQLIFNVGIAEPVALFNYLNYELDDELKDMVKSGGGSPGFFLEPVIPEIEIKLDDNKLHLEINNPLNKPLPYGAFLWDEKLLKINNIVVNQKPPGIIDMARIPEKGVFIRILLKEGKNVLVI